MDNRFGTTTGMVIQTVMENVQEICLAIDERGLYLTSANYLDKNLADPTAIPAAGPPPKPACWPSIWTPFAWPRPMPTASRSTPTKPRRRSTPSRLPSVV